MQNIRIVQTDMAFRTREAYKTLRSNIEFSGNNVRTIAITSCTPNEGKSEVSFELALSIAQNNYNVLLVDADLRKSVMREHFKSGKVRFGLSNYLVGRCSLEEAICETDVPGFHMIFSGPTTPTPSELLNSVQFDKLLYDASQIYDFVIIDTPPVGSVIDGAIIGKKCDGTVMVIASGTISYRFAQNVLDQLRKADCRILGCVLNKVNMSSGKGYYGKYYGRYYGKYYGKYYGNYGNDDKEI